MKRPLAGFLAAWVFLTRIPLPAIDFEERDFESAAGFYPLVGVLIGAIGAAAFWIGWAIGGALIAAFFAVAATLLTTGAFHEDGLADVFDGLGAQSRERMMEIMRDSRLGTFGVSALFVTLGLKVASLQSLPFFWTLAALPLAHAISRLSAVLAMATSRYVRSSGIASSAAKGVPGAALTIAAITGLAGTAAFAAAMGIAPTLAGLAGLAMGHIAARLLFERKLGGYTGDCLGTVQQLSELGFYLGLLAWH